MSPSTLPVSLRRNSELHAPITTISVIVLGLETGVILAPEMLLRRYRAELSDRPLLWECARKSAHVFTGLLFASFPQLRMSRADYLFVAFGLIIFPLLHKQLRILEPRPGVWKTWTLILLMFIPFTFGRFWIYVAGFLIYAVPDSLASIIGKTYGRPRKWLGGKSLLGSSVYTASAAALLVGLQIHWAPAIGIALILATIEVMSRKGFDNLFCPAACSVLLYVGDWPTQ